MWCPYTMLEGNGPFADGFVKAGVIAVIGLMIFIVYALSFKKPDVR